MAKVALYNMEGVQTGSMEVSDAVFAAEVNKSVLHQVVVNYLANQRQGTQSTKTRTEVRGGGAKPWRQKGTGRARQGSIRAPQWTGGGVALGPKPRSYRFSVNKKVKRIALKSALSAKYADYKVFVVDGLEVDEIKTSKIVALLKGLEVSKALIVTAEADEKVYKSARNIKGVKPTFVGVLNTYDVLKYNTNDDTKLAAIADFDKVLSLSLIEKADARREELKKQAVSGISRVHIAVCRTRKTGEITAQPCEMENGTVLATLADKCHGLRLAVPSVAYRGLHNIRGQHPPAGRCLHLQVRHNIAGARIHHPVLMQGAISGLCAPMERPVTGRVPTGKGIFLLVHVATDGVGDDIGIHREKV